MKEDSLQGRIQLELDQAYLFRARGNEGRARVCARRAAGWAVAAFRQRWSGGETHLNAYQQLQWFRKFEDVPSELRRAADRLITHVTPSHDLPHCEDPLEDAEVIVHALLGEMGRGRLTN